MPRYEFECNRCKEKFEILLSIKDREFAMIVCPNCKSQDTTQIYSGIYINTRNPMRTGSNGCGGGSGCCG